MLILPNNVVSRPDNIVLFAFFKKRSLSREKLNHFELLQSSETGFLSNEKSNQFGLLLSFQIESLLFGGIQTATDYCFLQKLGPFLEDQCLLFWVSFKIATERSLICDINLQMCQKSCGFSFQKAGFISLRHNFKKTGGIACCQI